MILNNLSADRGRNLARFWVDQVIEIESKKLIGIPNISQLCFNTDLINSFLFTAPASIVIH